MEKRKRSQLIIKYIFTFDIEPIQWRDPSEDSFWRTFFSDNPIDFPELEWVDILPKKWKFSFLPARGNPWVPRRIRAVDKDEEEDLDNRENFIGSTEEKYTYYVNFDEKYKDEVMEFLKFADYYDEYVFYEE